MIFLQGAKFKVTPQTPLHMKLSPLEIVNVKLDDLSVDMNFS